VNQAKDSASLYYCIISTDCLLALSVLINNVIYSLINVCVKLAFYYSEVILLHSISITDKITLQFLKNCYIPVYAKRFIAYGRYLSADYLYEE